MTFSEKVYEITREIPMGRVATYKQVATMAGNPNASRAVGALMRANPDAPKTPCHRVVSSKGEMTGYFGKRGIATKKEMLIDEGVIFIGERVDLQKSQWTGSKTS